MTRPPAPRWDRSIRTVGYEDDIAGPALRVAQRERPSAREMIRRDYRIAQQDREPRPADSLEELMERPLGTQTDNLPTEPRQIDEMPADPFDEAPFGRDTDPQDDASQDYFQSPAETDDAKTDDIADDLADDLEDDLARPFGRGDTIARTDDADRRNAREVEASRDACAQELAKLRANRLATVDLSIGIAGVPGEDFPYVCSIDDGTIGAPRCWAEITYMWKASALCHKPLYFEDVALERYGHSWGPFLQPIMSGAHFFGRLPVLPYCMGLKTPGECVYTLGHYRPGSCAPYLVGGMPFSWRAALFQAGGAVGVAAFLP